MSEKRKMLNVDVRENQDDAFHKWKMPPLEVTNTGKGRNSKTHLKNLPEVATCIGASCDPRFLQKFLGIELSTSAGILGQSDYYLKGIHEPVVLQDKLFDYIEHFALCPACGKAHIKLSASKQKKSHNLAYKCGACGNVGPMKRRHKHAGKMFKYICNILRTEKKKKRKSKPRVSPTFDEDLSPEKEDVVFADADFDDWVMDPDSSRIEAERAKEAEIMSLFVGVPTLDRTPQALLREILTDPNASLLTRVSEFERILSARRIEDELKIARIVVQSTLQFSSKQKLSDSIQRHGVFLTWFCEDRERALILISLTSELLLNNGLLSATAQILERMYDSQILTLEVLLYWNSLPGEQCYILKDPNDVHDVKEQAKPFISWLESVQTS